MKRRRNLWALALVAAVALAPSLSAKSRKPRRGDQVADFTFRDFSGRPHHLSEFAGRYVLLDFWATWCPPCLKEIPTLQEARRRFQSRGLVIIGMNSDKQLARAQQFVGGHHIPWLQSSPESTRQVLRHVLKIRWYPSLILLGPQGTILAVSLDEKPPLYGDSLLKTLDRTLPAAAHSAGASL
jgi:thiol-disulfide isomerase/thioredoxin